MEATAPKYCHHLKEERRRQQVVIVSGSGGYLGAALCAHLKLHTPYLVVGIDIRPSLHTTHVGDISDSRFIQEVFNKYGSSNSSNDDDDDDSVNGSLKSTEIFGVLHTAALHKPQVATHSLQQFLAVNVTGTLNLLENSVKHSVQAFVFTSTTSVFIPSPDQKSTGGVMWITEETPLPRPKNIYTLTKISAENFVHLFHQQHSLPVLILRISRFFPEEDDTPDPRISAENMKSNEYLYRRVSLQDVVEAHVIALHRAKVLEFDTFIISAKTPFVQEDLAALAKDTPSIVAKYFSEYKETYDNLGWHMNNTIDRVYVSEKAERVLGFTPSYNFVQHLLALKQNKKL